MAHLVNTEKYNFLTNSPKPPRSAAKLSPGTGRKETELDLIEEEAWLNVRDRALKPTFVSELSTGSDTRREFLRGAEFLRLHGERRRPGMEVVPQQLLVNDMLAAGHGRNAILLPRRSSKSTSLIAVALGRAEAREDYRVGILTMTTGKAGRSRFTKDVVPPLEYLYPDKGTRPMRIIKSAAGERIVFASGGFVQWLSTIEDVRGEAFDLIIFDEAGEAEPAKVIDALSAAVPATNTRPGAQLVAAGTAGRYRKGNLLYDWLEDAKVGRAGILAYQMPDLTVEEDVDTWEKIRPAILDMHPGIGTLTTEEQVRDSYETLPLTDFLREYGGIFGAVGGTGALIDPEWWDKARVTGEVPSVPENAAVAFAVHPSQSFASLVAAWRDENGVAYVGVIRHQPYSQWVADAVYQRSRVKRFPIAYDTGSGPAKVEAEKLERAKPRPELHPQSMRDIITAAALLVDELRHGRLRHFDQPDLNNAARIAVKRRIGREGGWGMGRVLSDDQITTLEAAAMALRVYDNTSKTKRTLPRVYLEPTSAA